MTPGRSILFTSAKVVLDQRPFFEKYAPTSALPANFHTNTVKYGQVGGSVTSQLSNVNVLEMFIWEWSDFSILKKQSVEP